MKVPALLLALASTPLTAATILGVNFNNNDAAGAQGGGSTFGADWTDINATSGTGLALSGTAVTLDWSASNFWQAGSWTGSSGPNDAIGTMRVYLDDGGSGVSITLDNLSTWLTAESRPGYTVTIYASTDSDPGTFHDADVNGSALPIPVGGNGTWDGTSEDTNGNISSGTRGSATTGVLTADTLDITMPTRNGSERGTIAAVVIETVPEPGTTLLGSLGLMLLLRRRSR